MAQTKIERYPVLERLKRHPAELGPPTIEFDFGKPIASLRLQISNTAGPPSRVSAFEPEHEQANTLDCVPYWSFVFCADDTSWPI